MKLCCWRVKEEDRFILLRTLSSSCPLSDHWECFSYELLRRRQHHNHVIQSHCLQFFWSVQIIFSRVFYCCFSPSTCPRHSFRTFYLTVKVWHFCHDHVWNWCSVILKCSKHFVAEQSTTANILTTTAASSWLEIQVRVFTLHLLFVYGPNLCPQPVCQPHLKLPRLQTTAHTVITHSIKQQSIQCFMLLELLN